MRRLVAILALAIAAIVVVDVSAPAFIGLEPGSFWAEPQAAGLELLPFDTRWDDPECADPTGNQDEPCARRYAFRAGATLTVWFSVRNAGPVPITLVGVSEDWIEEYQDIIPLARPVAGLDGGDPRLGVPELAGVPFEAMRLSPGGDRLIGVEFLVTDEVDRACEHWQGGGAVVWDRVPLSWSMVVAEHDQELALSTPVSFMAPTAEDCS